jgi:hypothetical protein
LAVLHGKDPMLQFFTTALLVFALTVGVAFVNARA